VDHSVVKVRHDGDDICGIGRVQKGGRKAEGLLLMHQSQQEVRPKSKNLAGQSLCHSLAEVYDRQAGARKK
jgi:hypothetical protein